VCEGRRDSMKAKKKAPRAKQGAYISKKKDMKHNVLALFLEWLQ